MTTELPFADQIQKPSGPARVLPDPERVSVQHLVESALHACSGETQAKWLSFVHIFDDFNMVSADARRISRSLGNLLINLMRVSAPGGNIEIRSRLESSAGSRRLAFVVQDTVKGLGAGQISRIFERFEREEDAGVTHRFGELRARQATSTSVRWTNGATLNASSEAPDRGSVFTLSVPVETKAAARTGSMLRTDHGGNPSMDRAGGRNPEKRLHILLVEDHEDTAAVLVRLLSTMGHTVVHAPSVSAALKAASDNAGNGAIDLVVSDLSLPDGSGLTLMRELAARHALIGIAVSGYSKPSDIRQSEEAGFVRHLTKPIDMRVLRQTIAELF